MAAAVPTPPRVPALDMHAHSIFRCPMCYARLPARTEAWVCASCGTHIPVVDGVPVLLRDRETVERAIADARQSARGAWYEDEQTIQLTGPYRHHVAKRRAYVERVLADAANAWSGCGVGLDLGCGDGVNLDWLGRYAGDLYGSDYNLTRLRRAAATNSAQVFLADAVDYPTIDEAFDFVYVNHVLEHIADDVGALSEVHRILRPGGVAVLGVPNEGAMFWRLAYRLQPSSRATTDHVHFYTEPTLVEKCERVGFTVKSRAALGWGVPHWAVDTKFRSRRWIDDLFERVGRVVVPHQASSLYLVLSR